MPPSYNQSPVDQSLVAQGAVHLPPGGLNGTFWGIQRVTHALTGMIEALARPLTRAFLMAGGQAHKRQGTGSNQKRNTHQNLLSDEDWRNDPKRRGLHRRVNDRVEAT